MGKFSLSFIIFLGGVLFFSESFAADFAGCPYHCERMANSTANRATAGGEWTRTYDSCMRQTKAEGFCGSVNLPAEVPIPTARPDTNSCQKNYQELRDKCESSIYSTGSSCDESKNQAMQDSAQAAQTSSQNTGSSVQNACNQTNNISNSAKNALLSFRQECSGALDTCRTKCAELATFLKENTYCYSTLGLSEQSAETLANSKNRSCEVYQTKLDDADKSIANYTNTGSSSAACQNAASGLSGIPSIGSGNADEQNAEPPKTFCELNPTYPGCAGGSVVANCNDPSQANSKVCVCSRNPRDSMCTGQSNGSIEQASVAIDSSSRLPSTSNDSGDIPDAPGISPASLRSSGHGPGDTIDGSQGGGSVGSATVGSGMAPKMAAEKHGDDMNPNASAGSYGSSGGGLWGGRVGPGGLPYRAGAPKTAVTGNEKPGTDLRQFLPGGLLDPKTRGIAGKSEGLDGLTGPHSNIWRKIQNRYQIIAPSLLP